MKAIISYACYTGHSMPGGPFLQIRDAVLTSKSGVLDDRAVEEFRETLRMHAGTSVSIIAITKLETP